MFCENCGNELNEGQKFCPKCGHKIELVEVEKKGLSDTTNSTDSDKHSEVLNWLNRYIGDLLIYSTLIMSI